MGKLGRFLLVVALICGVLIGIGRATAIRWWRVPTNDPYLEASLSPTLHPGDWVILWRFSAPYMGDLVLCPEPKTPTRDVVARVAGIGGDTVTIDGASVSINGRKATTESKCNERRFTVNDPASHQPVELGCVNEELGDGTHMRSGISGEAPLPFTLKVEQNQFFLLSDNRQFPWDSREFGAADSASCKETVIFRLWGAAGFFGDVEHRLTIIH
jgi:signal peptidase I